MLGIDILRWWIGHAMVTKVEGSKGPAVRAAARRRAPRWLALPLALPLFLAGGLVVGAVANLGVFGGWIGHKDGGRVAAAEADREAEGALAALGACGQIRHIVETSCSLRQRDRDATGIRECVAYELKYTMWGPYGCQ
jgi:hypothetical protein